MWAALIGGSIVAAFVLGYANFDVLMWPSLALLITFTPMVLAWLDKPDAQSGVVPAPRAELAPELAYELDPERTVKIRAVA
jgi:hypothetical protein